MQKTNKKPNYSTYIFYFLFFYFLVSSTFYFLDSKQALASEHLQTPTIAVYPDVYYPFDEILYLEGRASPNSTVQITFQKQGAKPINLNTRSDTNGEWVLAEKAPLKAGNWEIRARLVKSTGETSAWSNPRIVKAIITGVTIGGFTVKFAMLIFIIIVVIAVSVSLVLYFYFKMRRYETRTQAMRIRELQNELARKTTALNEAMISKDKEEARVFVEKSFSELQNAISREMEHIENSASNRSFTKEEAEHREHLLTQLRDIESQIEEKIKSISD